MKVIAFDCFTRKIGPASAVAAMFGVRLSPGTKFILDLLEISRSQLVESILHSFRRKKRKPPMAMSTAWLAYHPYASSSHSSVFVSLPFFHASLFLTRVFIKVVILAHRGQHNFLEGCTFFCRILYIWLIITDPEPIPM